LLTDTATVNTKPQLEIYADDVKCSHGSSTGQLDADALFYLRSRGLGEDSAKALLMYAFANDIINHIEIEALKEYVDNILTERFIN
jgi:Fe-S cluster assembly protein SufD